MLNETRRPATIRRVAVLVAVALSVPTALAAKPARSFTELKDRVRPGRIVHVSSSAGEELSGPVVEVTDTHIVMMVFGTRHEIEQAMVLRVEEDGDRVTDGALKGGAVGALGLFLCGPCAVGGALVYGGIGAIVDLLHEGRTRLYEAPSRP